MLSALRAVSRVGEITTPNTFPYHLQFAWQERLGDGGQRIILIADRPMSVWKEAMPVQPLDDTFTVIEIRFIGVRVDGEGKVAIGSNITVNRSLDLVELKEYDIEPVRLIDVHTRRPTT